LGPRPAQTGMPGGDPEGVSVALPVKPG
jgi:hypothetical protein